jgi:hypothetical protein
MSLHLRLSQTVLTGRPWPRPVRLVANLAVGATLVALLTAASAAPDTAGWSQVPSPRGGSLPAGSAIEHAVSCVSASACLAVGSVGEHGGLLDQTQANLWNGSSWSLLKPLDPDEYAVFNGVSCVTATECVAVGADSAGTLAELWNGRTWSVLTTVNVGNGSSLLAVSCASTTACTAVGYHPAQRGGDRVLAESWNGTTWSLSAAPSPAGPSSVLDAVSCPSASACVAVGSSQPGRQTRSVLAESWNGTQWSLLDAPNPSHHASLTGVSCPSVNSCIAVGSYQSIAPPAKTPDQTRTLAESWNGTTWSLMSSANPRPPADGDVLSAVSCVSPTACTAVGSDENRRAASLTLAESWNGTNWSILPAADVADNTLSSVSCTTATQCLAVGHHGVGVDVRTLAESWQAGQWLVTPAPGVPSFPSESLFNAVSCASATNCLAVGYYSNNVSVSRTLAARWNGTRWLRTLTPGLGNSAQLTGVSCPSATFCVAVGQGLSGLAVAESWNGSTWSVMRTPAITGGFSAVSCSSATSCIAVGDRENTHQVARTLAESWNGSTWSVSTTQNPSGPWNDLYAVSCSSATSCLAVGTSIAQAGGNQTLAESWNGATWSLTPTPAMTSSYYILDGVSCVSADACLAVGTRRNVYGTTHSLAESWNGAQWSEVRTRHIGVSDGFGAVSCVSASRCTAVSSYATRTAVIPLAESWNGTAWTQIPAQQPSSYSIFNGVSCVSATDCVAAGTTGGGTLIETG